MSPFADPAQRQAAIDDWRRRHPERVATYQRRYERNNPEKRAAYHQVRMAVKDGRLTKPDACEACGKDGRLEAHHTDYSKPLDVQWLCPACHTTTKEAPLV